MPAAAPAATAAPKSPPRMTLASVTRGRLERPRRILLHGVEGVGKTSFALGATNPIYICPEDGTSEFDVPRFPEPRTWTDVLDAIEELRTGTHDHVHLVLDTLDWLEPMLWRHICLRDGQENIEGYGYGKGYVAALDEWRLFIAKLERLRAERSMHIVMLAHSWIKQFKNPEGEDFDRYQMKLHDKAGGLLREWSDVVLFANYETFAHEDKKKRVRGVSSGVRVMYTTRTAAYDAKNRYNLPPQLALDWQAFEEAIVANRPAEPETVIARIREILADVKDDALAAGVEKEIAKAPTDAARLARVLNKLAAVVSAKENAA